MEKEGSAEVELTWLAVLVAFVVTSPTGCLLLAIQFVWIILGFLGNTWSRHRASMACRRLLAAERATLVVMALHGEPSTPES